MTRSVLVTGGAGYIGSHTALELLQDGYDVTIFDNLSNSSQASVQRLAEISGRDVAFVEGDIRDADALDAVFESARPEAVVHFAALKAVGESTQQPLRYHENNVSGTIRLLEAMERHEVRRMVFSSTCAVYGEPESMPVTEQTPIAPMSPYSRTKLMAEDIMRDIAACDDRWRVFLLRYFNAVGAHPSGRIGEHPRGVPNNLMPFVMQAAVGMHEKVGIFGDDYPTPDGTGVRDYIHVVDLAAGHVAAIAHLDDIVGCETLNLGTGSGHSVLEVVRTAEAVVGRPIPHAVVARRAGDIASMYADSSKAEAMLGWKATRDLQAMVEDAWRWQSSNPRGYEDASRAS